VTNPTLIRLAKRIAAQMMILTEAQNDPSKDPGDKLLNLKMFTGLGLALGFVFEEITETNCSKMNPREILKWAINELPNDVPILQYRRLV
jgi:hypothetical protein